MKKFIKKIISKNFVSFTYFFRHIRYKLFVVLFLSIGVSLLDGFGLAMFLPLLQMVNDPVSANPESLGNLKFLVNLITSLGFSLNLLSVLLFIFFFFALKAIAIFFNDLYQVSVQLFFSRKIRVENVLALNKLSYKAFVLSDVGQIQNTMTGEVDRAAKAYESFYVSLQQGTMVLVYIGFALFIDVQFALLVSLGGFLTNFIYKKIYVKTKKASYKLSQETNRFQGLIIQYVTNFKYLKATGLLLTYGNKITDGINVIITHTKKLGQLSALVKSTREPLIIGVVTAVIFLQIKVLDGALGPIFISLLFFYRALNSLMLMQSAWNGFLSLSGTLKNVTEFYENVILNREKNGKEIFSQFSNKIELNNISFYYGEDQILKDINLTINKNETIAFVGESGSGKTTLVSILAGLMPIEHGDMKIDSMNRNNLKIETFQKKVGYISQDPVIFNDTIFNNVTFWADPNAENKKRFEYAIEKASVDTFISTLDERENAMLGNNGINLSGGQKQRISIARELYKNIDILVLDEATSSLDSETEKTIQNNIDKLQGYYTIFIVAHRLSTIKNADRIVYMNKGRILTIGTFEELLVKAPDFKRMVELQGL